MSDSYSQLKQLATAIQPLSENEWSAFSSIWTECSAKRKEPLTEAGEKEKYLYFVIEGIQRVYYFDEQNREAVESPKGVTPLGSHGTVRESLLSYGSSCLSFEVLNLIFFTVNKYFYS